VQHAPATLHDSPLQQRSPDAPQCTHMLPTHRLLGLVQ
jgi:hypothetical protein